MEEFCVRGVVRGGQVVLDAPLDLPDGTVVAISELASSPPEADKLKMLTLLNRLDLLDYPDWRQKVEPDRAAYFEKLVLEMAGMWADRDDLADPEAGVR
jgi:hypothetical protein